MKRIIERRKFLKNASCAALGTTTLWNTMLNLKSINAATHFNSSVAVGGEYKALVCLLLGGGSDSFNMLIPTTTDEYNMYATTRSNLAVPNFDCNDPDNTENVLPIGSFDCLSNPISEPTHGVNPNMPRIKNLYNDGKLAFVSNVGSLIEPVEKSTIYNGNTNLPLGLFSHIDQVAHWQTAIPQDRVATGWGGKMADLLIDANEQDIISMNMSFSGSNIFQTGDSSVEYALAARNLDNNFIGGSLGLSEFGWESMESIRSMAVNSIVDATYQDIFKKTYVNTLKTARDGHALFSSAFDQRHNFTAFDVDDLSRTFATIAETISVQSQMQMNRQIFFVEVGGWDHHDGLGDDYNGLLDQVDRALSSFQTAMEDINMQDCVTTFTISEFGRTLTSNGNGSDHAWGGNMMVMGGAVNGGQIYGDYPSLELDGPLEIGGGVLIPTLSADEYFAEIARWFGVMDSDLPLLFPNIGAFYDINSGVNPIGFMT